MGVDMNDMSEAARRAQREYKRLYMRRWRAANRERVAANNARYWERVALREASYIEHEDGEKREN